MSWLLILSESRLNVTGADVGIEGHQNRQMSSATGLQGHYITIAAALPIQTMQQAHQQLGIMWCHSGQPLKPHACY